MYAWWGVSGAALVAWILLVGIWGFFWRPQPRLEPPASPAAAGPAPSVVAVIPARDEADILPEALPTVLRQAYPGPLRVILVDDRSEDGTGEVAASLARAAGEKLAGRLEVIVGSPRPAGWSGKVWAMQQGVAAAGAADFYWFTDADIAHEPWVLVALVGLAEADRVDLVSTMATLRVISGWDRLLVPAFVYFFAKLYPFRFVRDRRRRTAGAAGGCMLVRRTGLEQAGGLFAIRSAWIDDCALARRVKRAGGGLWLGFSSGVRSLRGYGSLAGLWEMVARSAYTQLRHSPAMLVGTVFGMAFLYLSAPAACLAGLIAAAAGTGGGAVLAGIGAAAWGLMAGSFIPLLHHHGVSGWLAPLLPVAGALYTAMTISSAWRHARGRGGAWKGRTY